MGPSANGTTNHKAMHGETELDLEAPSAVVGKKQHGKSKRAASQVEDDDDDEAQVIIKLVLFTRKHLQHATLRPSVNITSLVCIRPACGLSLLNWSLSSPAWTSWQPVSSMTSGTLPADSHSQLSLSQLVLGRACMHQPSWCSL